MKEISIGKFDVELKQSVMSGKMGMIEYCTLKATSKDQVFKKKKAMMHHVGKRVEVFFRVVR